jgi:glucose/arabinose dehydrogenase
MKEDSRLAQGAALVAMALMAVACAVLWLGARATPLRAAAAITDSSPRDGTEPLPAGASIQTILSNMNVPVAMAFDPAGRLFYTEKTGDVRLYANGVLQPTPVIHFNVDSSGERGLLGIAIDPTFNANHYVYVYYTCGTAGGCTSLENRVVRFVENNGVGSNPERIFWSPQTAGNHNGGNIHFGPDGNLYVSVGDNANAQDVTVKNGKMHRINSDGTIPPDNPVFTQTGALPSLYAIGLRNSFDFAFDSLVPTRIFASENGPGCDDEMNRIEAGYNYGWRDNYPCDDPSPSIQYNTIPPLWFLASGECCEAPTGIAVYTGLQVRPWTNHLFMANYNTGAFRHFYLSNDRTVVTTTNVVLGVTANMDIETGPDGALWYIEGGGYSQGTLKRIVGAGGTDTPTKTSTPTPSSVTSRTSTPLITATSTWTATGTRTVLPSATPTPCSINFSDVHPGDWFYEYVRCLFCGGAISGYGDNTFRPHNDTTRGQLCKIVILAFQIPIDLSGAPHYTDVPSTHPFYQYIETATNNGLLVGYADHTFRPGNNVTRGQLSKIIVNGAILRYNWTLHTPGQPTFSDVPPGYVFYSYIETAVCHGIISGYADGTFRPGNNATRAQIAKIVCLATRNGPACDVSTPTPVP